MNYKINDKVWIVDWPTSKVYACTITSCTIDVRETVAEPTFRVLRTAYSVRAEDDSVRINIDADNIFSDAVAAETVLKAGIEQYNDEIHKDIHALQDRLI